jgi:hypothetical protein
MNAFTCPRCGGRHWGADPEDLDRVSCHCDQAGRSYTTTEAERSIERPPYRGLRCGWTGRRIECGLEEAMLLRIDNHGPLITGANYWDMDFAREGKFFLSTNAGAFRLLIPPSQEAAIQDMRTAAEVIVSRGPWPEGQQADALEVLFDDGSADPLALWLDLRSVDRVPADSDAGRELIFSAWTKPRRGRPHKALERPAWYRLAPRLPYMRGRDEQR